MTLWKTYYHLVWSTRDRHELILDQHEAALYQQICKKANILESPIHAIGGMSDHLHLVVSIPPKLSIAEFVKSIKGSSSRTSLVGRIILRGSGNTRCSRWAVSS
jgi:putative transposase